MRSVFGIDTERVPPNDAMSRFVGFGDKIWDNLKNSFSDSLDNEGRQTYVELRKLASAMSIWRTTLAVTGHLSLAWLTRNR